MRDASTYRAARRNTAKALRNLAGWREVMAARANHDAELHARAAVANEAREVAAKAMTEAKAKPSGLPTHVLMLSAQLAYYRGLKRTRPVSRIIRQLESQVRA